MDTKFSQQLGEIAPEYLMMVVVGISIIIGSVCVFFIKEKNSAKTAPVETLSKAKIYDPSNQFIKISWINPRDFLLKLSKLHYIYLSNGDTKASSNTSTS